MLLSDVFLSKKPHDEAPEQISMALQTVKTIDAEAADIYEEFLEKAVLAEQACRETGIQILGQYKLTDALPTNLNPDEATNTLLLIFQFYAKIKTASSHATFSAAEDDVNFMSFSKVEIFCRDFKIVPRLLTREELKMLWGDIARAHVLAGRGIFTVIDADQFKDLIIRMALWAYHKPGLKKLVITLEGFMPRNAEILQSFCHYLKLPDVQFINNFIRTKGRQTQGELNYRSKGETNLRTRLEVRADTDARKLSQVKAGVGSGSGSGTSGASANGSTGGAKTPGKGKKMNMFGELEYEERHLRGANPHRVVRLHPLLQSPSSSSSASAPSLLLKTSLLPSSSALSAEKKKKASLLPASLEEKLQPMDSAALLLLLRKAGRDPNNNDDEEEQDEDEDDDFGMDSPREASHHNNNNNNKAKSSGNSGGGGSRAKHDDDDSDDDDELSRPSRAATIRRRQNAKKKAKMTSQYRFQAPDEVNNNHNEYDDDDNMSLASSVLSVFHDNSFDALKAAYEADYDPRLVKQELARYCYVPPVAHSTEFLPTKGPVIDLGLLQSGAKVTVQFRVSNGAGDDVFLDASARDFFATDTHISTFSRMLVPGMSRHVSVTFTVPAQNCRVLGHVDVVCMAPRHTTIASLTTGRNTHHQGLQSNETGGHCFISCPVFYRVDCVSHRDVYPVCTAGSLRPLVSRSSRRSADINNNNNSSSNNNFGSGSLPTSRLNTANNNNYNSNSSNNVIVNSRLGTAAGTRRSDWDTRFMAQRVSVTSAALPVSPLTLARPNTVGTVRGPSSSSPLVERWPSSRFTALTELPFTRTGQQMSVQQTNTNANANARAGSRGSSPMVPRVLERQLSLPRPASPVPPSVGGALTASATLQLQRAPYNNHHLNNLNHSNNSSRPMSPASHTIQFFDNAAPVSPGTPQLRDQQQQQGKNNSRSHQRLLDNLNQTAPL